MTIQNHRMQAVRFGSLRSLLCVIVLLLLCFPVFADDAGTVRTLEGIDYSSLPGDRVEIRLSLSGAAMTEQPVSFTTNQPARIALDLGQTASKVAKRKTIGLGAVRSLNAIESQGRTRIVINLSKPVTYDTRLAEGALFITVASDAEVLEPQLVTAAAAPAGEKGAAPQPAAVQRIDAIDFRRGENGEGRIKIRLSDKQIPVALTEEGRKLVLRFSEAKLPGKLQQRLDVIDFATPVSYVDSFVDGSDVKLVVTTSGAFEHMAYQAGDAYTLEVKPVDLSKAEHAGVGSNAYVGERLSLNFQDIEVRAVLQLIADFTDLNMVVSDTVKGGVTLRLENVPWDQALDIILQTRGLAKRKMGNVLLVAPSDEIAAREKQAFESQQEHQKLAPLRTELVQVNYAKAQDMAALLKGEENSILSERGSVTVDERTNSLLIADTAEQIEDVKDLLVRLDVPVRQVLIESRVVIANDDFSKELGVRAGLQEVSNINLDTGVSFGSNGVGYASGSLEGIGSITEDSKMLLNAEGLNVDLPVIGQAGRFAYAVLGADYLLSLELSAMQAEGRGEVISSPRVVTSDQNKARIEQGVEIPYQQATSSGATNVSFKSAVLSLEVTPQITPDDRVIMDLLVNKDSESPLKVLGVPTIDTRKIETQVLVNDGETVVLGGIYEQTTSEGRDEIPFFGSLPVIGNFFRHTTNIEKKNELLVFVTPKILKGDLAMQ